MHWILHLLLLYSFILQQQKSSSAYDLIRESILPCNGFNSTCSPLLCQSQLMQGYEDSRIRRSNISNKNNNILKDKIACKVCKKSASPNCKNSYFRSIFKANGGIIAAYCNDDWMVIISSNIPNHNYRSSSNLSDDKQYKLTVTKIPIIPQMELNNNYVTVAPYSVVSITTSGQHIYSNGMVDNPLDQSKHKNEISCTIDQCHGTDINIRNKNNGYYRYIGDPFHPVPGICMYSISDYSTDLHPPLIGWGLDGYEIYGRYIHKKSIGVDIPLDECGGHQHSLKLVDNSRSNDEAYHYHSQVLIGANISQLGHIIYNSSVGGVHKCWKGKMLSSNHHISYYEDLDDYSQLSIELKKCCNQDEIFLKGSVENDMRSRSLRSSTISKISEPKTIAASFKLSATNPTARPSSRPSRRPTSRPSSRPSMIPTYNPTTATPSSIPSTSPTNPTNEPTPNPSTAPSAEPSATPISPTNEPTVSPSSSPTSSPSSKPSPSPTVTPTSSPTSFPTTPPSSTPTSCPSSLPTAVPTIIPSSSPSGYPTAAPSTSSPTAAPSPEPSPLPSAIPSMPTNRPSPSPTRPTSTPTSLPTSLPTANPSTSSPTCIPTSTPSSLPTSSPTTHDPTSTPTNEPSSIPTTIPTSTPTTALPSAYPSSTPTSLPTTEPTSPPTGQPTTSYPSLKPSKPPTSRPSSPPSSEPSINPTEYPSPRPTRMPSNRPSTTPTSNPSNYPTAKPTPYPTSLPSFHPSFQPSIDPTSDPTTDPTSVSSNTPTKQPIAPSPRPTTRPSNPTNRPSRIPSSNPSTTEPSFMPTPTPSSYPSTPPSTTPTSKPSLVLSSSPSSAPSSSSSAIPTLAASYTPSSSSSSESSIVWIEFKSNISLFSELIQNCSSLNKNSKLAFINVTAESMKIATNNVDLSGCVDEEEDHSHNDISSITLEIIIKISLKSVGNEANDLINGTYYYELLMTRLNSSVSSGHFQSQLNYISQVSSISPYYSQQLVNSSISSAVSFSSSIIIISSIPSNEPTSNPPSMIPSYAPSYRPTSSPTATVTSSITITSTNSSKFDLNSASSSQSSSQSSSSVIGISVGVPFGIIGIVMCVGYYWIQSRRKIHVSTIPLTKVSPIFLCPASSRLVLPRIMYHSTH
eukprot:gene6956-9512_t